MIKLNFIRKDFLKPYYKIVSYIFYKYIELIIMGLTMLLLAKKIGPTEMGLSIPSLLYITYSSYLSLGLNQLTIKKYATLSNINDKKLFLAFNFQFLVIIGILNFFLAYITLDKDFFLMGAIISLLNLLKSFFIAYYRVIDRIKVVNYNNLLLSLLLLIGVVFYTEKWEHYMLVWSISMFVVTIFFFIPDLFFLKQVLQKVLEKPNVLIYKSNIIDGSKLAIMGIISTIVLTADRFIINKSQASLDVLGSYQFSDNISTALYIGISSIVFYKTPEWIDLIRKKQSFIKLIYKNIYLSFIFLIPILFILFFTIKFFKETFYNEYLDLEYYVTVSLFLKTLMLFIGVTGIVNIGLNKENSYIRSMSIPLILVILVIILFTYFFKLKFIIIIPVLIITILMISLFFRLNSLRKLGN